MSAAKLVVMQIDHADSVIKLAKRDNKISITLPKFIGESEWDKNKHILVDRLDSTEMEIINTYFVACEQLEETRKITVNLQAEQLNAKARSIQHQLAEEIVRAQIDCNEYSQVDEINDILNKDVIPFSNRLDFLYKNQSFGEYEPQYFHNIFTQILNQKNIEIKGTAPYSKLRNIAGMG
ncbi:hypothetical protein C0Z01_14090 [Photobacterium kishitanii]|nr:hypothetical protein C0Z01_14090 [Photobacterium kishitanii]